MLLSLLFRAPAPSMRTASPSANASQTIAASGLSMSFRYAAQDQHRDVWCLTTRVCLAGLTIIGHHWPSGLLHVFQREEASFFSKLRILLWSTDSAVGSGSSFAFSIPIPGCYPIPLDIHIISWFRKPGHAVYQQSLRNVISSPCNVGPSIPFQATAMRKMFTTSVGCPSSYSNAQNKRSPCQNLKA